MEMEMRSAQVDAKGARAALDKAEERLRAARAALGALGALREDGAGALGGVGAGAVRKREEMLRKGQGG